MTTPQPRPCHARSVEFRRRIRTSGAPSAALVASVLLAGACASSADPEAAPTMAEAGPLTTYLAAASVTMDAEARAAAETQVQERIAACMADLGFPYTPVPTSGDAARADGPTDAEPGTLGFAQQYGYGLVWGALHAEPQTFEDVNAAAVAAMSDSERTAYEAALWGTTNAAPEPGAEPEPYDWTTAGCQGRARHEVDPAGEAWLSPGLPTEILRTLDSVDSDPEVVDAAGAWSACMADAGYPGLTVPDDAMGLVSEALAGVLGPGTEGSDVPVVVDRAGAADVAALETAVAVADLTCRDDVGYDRIRAARRDAIEQAFLDDHRAEIDAWLAAVGRPEADDT